MRKFATTLAALGHRRRWRATPEFPPATLTQVQRTSAAMLSWKLKDIQRTSDFTDERYVFHQHLGALHIGLINFLTQMQPVRNRRDAENYIARLERLAPVLDEGIAEAKARAARGILPPSFILEATIEGLDRFLSDAPAKNVLVTSLDQRMSKIENPSEELRSTSLVAAEEIVRTQMIPAFQRIRALLAEQMNTATSDAGLWRLPRGAEAYAAALATYTTTEMTPDQIHELGLREVARIEGEMDGLLRQLGYTEGTVKQRYAKLEADSQQPANPDPRPALLAKFDDILRDAEKRAELVFDLRPKAALVVMREPPTRSLRSAASGASRTRDERIPDVVRRKDAHRSHAQSSVGASVVRDHSPVRRWERSHRARHRGHAAYAF